MKSLQVLISVSQRFADAYRRGSKSVEVRRRKLNVAPGTRVWIYSKMPVGRVDLVGHVRKVVSGSPSRIWKDYGDKTALTRSEFFEYVGGCSAVSIVLIDDIRQLQKSVTLGALRHARRGFQPPQFAKFLRNDDALRRALLEAAGPLT